MAQSRSHLSRFLGRMAVSVVLVSGVALAQSSPTPFTYVVRTGVATNVIVTSEARTVTGFEGALPVSVSGGLNAQYRVGSGAWTAAPGGPIGAGQTLAVRHTSAATANAATVTIVTVGDYGTEFRSVTGEFDRTPDPFDFGTTLDVPPANFVESAPLMLTGFNAGLSIVPGPGAQYSFDGLAWTNVTGTLQPGQVLRMRHLTSPQPLAYTKTYLKVGGITGYFTTRNYSVPAEVSIDDASADEGQEGQSALSFTVRLSAPRAAAVSMAFATQDGTAAAGSDYLAAVGSVEFAPGETERLLSVTVLGDTVAEDDETFTVTLSSAPAGVTIADGEATGTIRNDDFPFLVGTGLGNHNPVSAVCVGGGSTNCGRRVDPVTNPDAIRDDLLARATAITGANGETYIVVSTTNIGYFLAYKPEQLGFNGIYDVRLRIAEATGVPSTNVTVVSDHSHNGPDTIGIWGGVSAEYMKITADSVVKAAVEAWQSRQPASLRVAAVNQNDNMVPGVPRLDSSYDRPPANDFANGTPANEFRMLVADGPDGRILTMVNYAPHATVLNGAATDQVSGDWAAWAPQEAEAEYGGFGLAAIGTVGATDWNKSGANADEKEAEARARLRTLMAVADAQLRTVQGDGVQVRSTFIREQITQPFLLSNYKPGLDRNDERLPSDGFDVRIDRSVLPPFLTGTVTGTYVSAVRIGDAFLSTFPGEPFGDIEHALSGERRVQGARAQFLLGGANDFFGYMVKKPETYLQTFQGGATWLGLGCPERDFIYQDPNPLEDPQGCADHWLLMVSATFGSHIVCTLQDSAESLGFPVGPRDTECPALTALDGLAPPPESGSPEAAASMQVRREAVQQAHALAQQCRATAAPAPLCDALAEGARQAEIYAGVDPAPAGGDGQAQAGVAVKDASWHLGASAGQFSASGAGIANDRGYDPYGHSVRKVGSDILGTRITTRALVVQGANGQRIAIASNDLYLPNDLLHRRTAQLLAEHDALAAVQGGVVTGITDRNLSTTSSHSHTSPFYSTPAWGTWIFQDVMDLRFYEYMARQMADAVIEAASSMKPVRMGGATVHANDIQAHTYGPKNVHDGTPAGQPRDYTTQAVTVVSFDDLSTGVPRPLANWVIFGVHPEWVWGEEIVNGDITHAVMRMLDRETGAVTVWSQRETGASGPHKDDRVHPPSARREYQESAFAGYDRAARYLTDSIKRALSQLAGGSPERPDQFAPYQTGFDVAFASQRFAPPVTRPYPGVSNCNSDRVFEGDVGTPITGLPDCDYTADEFADPVTEPFWEALPVNPAELARQLNEAGVPVPTSYSATSFSAVQETAAVHLQVFKLGTIAATMSPNEQFTSQALNLESRLDTVPDNLWHGFDWACVAQARGQYAVDEDPKIRAHCERQNARYPETGVGIPGNLADEDFPRARAQIHNDARGWELDPAYAASSGDTSSVTTLGGEAEPDDITQIKGNFTHEEFPDHGYDLVISVGMANDYWGYMAEYREYRAHSDGYRKALNALGPHGADFVATRLARMAANLNGANAALPFNPLDAAYQAESARAEAFARGMGELASGYSAAYELTLPPDGGAPAITEEPAATVKRFSAATVKFVGGSNYTDMPNVRVERLVSGTPDDGEWEAWGTQEGEVQLQLEFLPSAFSFSEEIPFVGEGLGAALPDPEALARWRAGQFEWVWTASFEAFISELDNLGARPGITPAGTYRFVVDGAHRGLMSFPNAAPYRLESRPFEVVPWNGITVEDLRLEDDGRVSFKVGPVNTFTTFKSGAGDGNTTRSPGYTVGPVDYPDSYTGGLSWIRNERQLFAGDEQYCGRCSFRPWADSAELAVSAIPVTVRRADASTYALSATLANGRWITAEAIGDGHAAFVAAAVIVDEYGERNGAASAEVTRGIPPPPVDTDGDGIPDADDACPTQPGPVSNNGCPVVVPPPPDAPSTGASLLSHCRAASPDAAVCDELETQLEPFVAECAAAGSEFGDDEAQAFCRGVLTGDLDALLALCHSASPEPMLCRPIEALADVLATRNPWLARRPLNISHRGGAEEFPENTLFAYARSLQVGSDMIEADVSQTSDGHIVVLHDLSVDRTTNGSGSVSSFTLAQIKALDAAYCFTTGGSNCGGAGPFPYRGIATGQMAPPSGFTPNDFRIPTLRELLERFPNTLINLEIKDGTGGYEGEVAAILSEYGRTDDVIVASFYDNASAAFKAQAPLVSTSVPTVQVAASVATGQGPSPGVTVGHEAFQVPIEFSGIPVINQEFVNDAHAQGLAVHARTIDNCNDMVDLLDLGVNGIMTDKPSLLQSVFEARAATSDRSQWPCPGTLTGPPPAESAGGVFGDGLLGALGRFLSALGEALLAALPGDFESAQATFTAAIETLGGDAEEIATGGSTEPAEILGTSRILPSGEEGACTPDNADWTAYRPFIGTMHEHSGYSDGWPGTTPADYYAQIDQRGFEFAGGSEHSDSHRLPVTVSEDCLSADLFASCAQANPDNPDEGVTKWDEAGAQARAATHEGFTAFRGFEWTSDRFGHINVYFSRNDAQAKNDGGYGAMEAFWTWFTRRAELGGGSDGLAVFNHPGREDDFAPADPGFNWFDLAYVPAADLRMVGIEVFNRGSDFGTEGPNTPPEGWYAHALDKGWHVGPIGAEDEHDTEWGTPARGKTMLIARENSEGALREALFARRFYAVGPNNNNLRLSFTADDRHPMGTRLAQEEPLQLRAQVTAGAAGVLEMVTTGGVVASSTTGTLETTVVPAAQERWYFVRWRPSPGASVRGYTAPIWVRAGGEYPTCGEWLAGDLHVHTTYSHDAYGGPNEVAEPLSQVAPGVIPGDDNTGPDEFYTFGHTVERQFAIAAARGLDYLAITDHNDIRSQSDPGFGAHGVLAVGGYEKSLAGHAQVLGAHRCYTAEDVAGVCQGAKPPLQSIADQVRADGGVFQVNHPAGESVNWHFDADWAEAADGSYEGDVVPDTVEVWNISWLWQAPAPSGNSLDDALRYWEGWLDLGHRVGATGGSDNHYVATTPIQGNGQPTTWVFATERSERGVIEGLRAGRSTISHQPPLLGAPRVTLEADADGDGIYEAMLGSEVPVSAALRARVSDAAGAQLRIVGPGGVAVRAPIPAFTPEFEYRFAAPAGASWIRAEAVEPDGAAQRATVCDAAAGDQTTYCRNRLAVLAMSSALYLRP